MDLTDRRRRAVLIAAIAGGVVLLLLIGIGVYGLLRGPDATTPTPTETTTTTAAPTPNVSTGARPGPVVAVGGPEAFAREVAVALFTWDTTSDYGPADYAQPLADVTTSFEADAAASDVRSYLPTPAVWTQLRTHQTRQWITIDSIDIPTAWEIAVQQAAPGQLLDGAVAYTVTGTRHREGTWNTEPVTTARPVAFTVFLTCAPEHATAPPPRGGPVVSCELLRLSQLDNPLR